MLSGLRLRRPPDGGDVHEAGAAAPAMARGSRVFSKTSMLGAVDEHTVDLDLTRLSNIQDSPPRSNAGWRSLIRFDT